MSSEINEKLDVIISQLKTLEKRVETVEKKQVTSNQPPTEQQENLTVDRETRTQSTRIAPVTDNSTLEDQGPQDDPLPEEIQAEFQFLKDSVRRINIPNDLRINVERTGIKREDQSKLNIIQNCAKYSETILKLIINSPDSNTELIQNISVIATAQQRYLQGEYATSLVQGNFGDTTAKLFRQLQRNSTSFPPSAIQNLQTAAQISSYQNQQQSNRRGWRGRGRSQFSSRGRGRGNYHHRDPYQGFIDDARIPTAREDQ